jgi:phage shock protein PspC (stress-responsive transcriptional regulator)
MYVPLLLAVMENIELALTWVFGTLFSCLGLYLLVYSLLVSWMPSETKDSLSNFLVFVA